MLVLTRDEDHGTPKSDVILRTADGTEIVVRVKQIKRTQVRVGFDAPASVDIVRAEIEDDEGSGGDTDDFKDCHHCGTSTNGCCGTPIEAGSSQAVCSTPLCRSCHLEHGCPRCQEAREQAADQKRGMSHHDISTLEGAVWMARRTYQRGAYALSDMYLCRAALNTRDHDVQHYLTKLLQHVNARRDEVKRG